MSLIVAHIGFVLWFIVGYRMGRDTEKRRQINRIKRRLEDE